MVGMELTLQLNGQIASACGDVEDLLGGKGAQIRDPLFPPKLINSERQCMVEQIILPGDRIKHTFYL